MTTGKVLEPLAAGARRFAGKVVIVAGAGQGIGSATVRRVAQEGGTVVIGDWVEETAKKVQQEVLDFGGQASVHQGNYQSWDDCNSLIDFTKQTYGRIDSLIVIVGGSIFGAPYQYLTPEQITATVNKNLWPTMYCVRAVLPHMIEQHYGSIVTLATHALVGTNRAPYAASKGALIGMTTALCKEVGMHAIRINCVAPSANTAGDRVTPRNYSVENIPRPEVPPEDRLERTVDEAGDRMERPLASGLHRNARAEEVAAAIAFVASDDASFITGEVISVGGGETYPF
jgi:benzoate/toluate 1,2-dioxygenase reductase subunit